MDNGPLEDNLHLAYSKIMNYKKGNKEWKTIKHENGRNALWTAAKSFGIEMSNNSFIVIEKNGGKIINDKGEVIASASISHTKRHSFAVVGDKKSSLGLDVENSKRNVGNEILNYIANNKDSSSIADPLSHWVKKESVTKATGHGMSISKELIWNENSKWNFGDEIYDVMQWDVKINSDTFVFALAKNTNSYIH